jgi:RNA polymerase sigma-70 factor, ECF subfamily
MVGHPELQEERRLVTQILAGQVQLFHELIQPYERTVYMMALSCLHNEADAEDAAQEAFLKAFKNLAAFRGEAKFGSWLISITLNEARSRIRRNKMASTESLDTTREEEGHVSPAFSRDWRESPSEALERNEIKLLLQQAIASLPVIYREVLLLREVEELNTDEVAKILKISISSAKVRLHRARLMMQKLLAPRLSTFREVEDSCEGNRRLVLRTRS